MSTAKAPADAKSIKVNGRLIDPTENYAQDARNTDYIIVTSRDILENDQKAELQKLQVEFLEDLGDHNILCRYSPVDLKPLRDLGFVRQVDVYRNRFKIPAVLLALIEELKETPEFETKCHPVDVMTHQEVKDLEALADHISKVAQVDRSQIQIHSDKIRLNVNLGQLEAITTDDRVRILERVVTPVLSDDQAKHIIGAPLGIPRISGFNGKEQTVAVYDTGFDLGSIQDCHPAFTGKMTKLIPVGRLIPLGPHGEDLTIEQQVDDADGHGTHVCGIIVGKEINTSGGMVGGVAQDAKVVLSSLSKSDGALETIPSIKKLFEEPYKNYQARVHSNSWGDGLGHDASQVPYSPASKEIDDFVRGKGDALVCFSAGNNNNETEEKPSIGSQAAAKNSLTVGASGSTREITQQNEKIYKISADKIYPKSSRGPTAEKRIKPDVVAPGVNIFSAHSRHPDAERAWRPEATSKLYPGVKWKVRTGASQATPLVSGCAAILRQILQSKGLLNPPAALLKAVIINGAHKLPGIDTDAQGFGLINLESSAVMLQSPPNLPEHTSAVLSPMGGTLVGAPLKQGDKKDFTLTPSHKSAASQLKITMVYNDIGGKELQNNLNLAVSNNVGVTKHGGVSGDIDQYNNVEQVIWSPAPKEQVTVSVTAQKILGNNNQDFALAWLVSEPTGVVH